MNEESQDGAASRDKRAFGKKGPVVRGNRLKTRLDGL
jgi:hypothetical protein